MNSHWRSIIALAMYIPFTPQATPVKTARWCHVALILFAVLSKPLGIAPQAYQLPALQQHRQQSTRTGHPPFADDWQCA